MNGPKRITKTDTTNPIITVYNPADVLLIVPLETGSLNANEAFVSDVPIIEIMK